MPSAVYRDLDDHEVIAEGDQLRAVWSDPDDWFDAVEFVGRTAGSVWVIARVRRSVSSFPEG